MEKELNILLKELNIIKKKYDLIRDNEEKFNIFSVMYKEHDERRLHSRFISNLLNPHASHKKNDLFLNHFVNVINKEIKAQKKNEIELSKFNNAVVYPEEWNKSEKDNIDILIIDRQSKNAIIIENKIWAGDSNHEYRGQLEGYYNNIKENENIPSENIQVLYLTLDEHEPSEESLGKYGSLEAMNGYCISYKSHILEWLNLCIRDVIEKPFIRESILQYQKLIEKLTNTNTNIEEIKEMKNLIAKDTETMQATKYLIDNFDEIMKSVRCDFFQELKKAINAKGIKKIDDSSESNDGGLSFFIEEDLEAFIWHENDWYIYWGFEENGIKNEYAKALKKLTKDKKIIKEGRVWWNWFKFKNDDYLQLKNFKEDSAFNLIHPEYRKKTINQIIEKIFSFIEEIKNIK